eukprot:Pgem_evm1s3492
MVLICTGGYSGYVNKHQRKQKNHGNNTSLADNSEIEDSRSESEEFSSESERERNDDEQRSENGSNDTLIVDGGVESCEESVVIPCTNAE